MQQLAWMLAEELPEHEAFRYTYVAVDGRMGLLEWGYEDSTVLVRDGVDSYLIEGGKIVAQTIHYTLEVKGRTSFSVLVEAAPNPLSKSSNPSSRWYC